MTPALADRRWRLDGAQRPAARALVRRRGRPRCGTTGHWSCDLDLDPGDRPRPGAGDIGPAAAAAIRSGAAPGLGGHRGRLGGDGPGPRAETWRPGQPGTATRVLAGLTSSGGGMVAAATMSLPERAEAGPQLRLPLRLDPRPVLHRAGRGRRRARTACSTTRSRFVADRAPGRRPRPQARLHGDRRPGARTSGAAAQLPGYPGRRRTRSATGSTSQFQLDALGRGAAAVRGGGPAMTTWTAGTGGRPRSAVDGHQGPAGATRTPGCGNSTTGAGPTPG